MNKKEFIKLCKQEYGKDVFKLNPFLLEGFKKGKKEIWKPIVGFEGEYEISNTGRIKRVEHFVAGNHGTTQKVKERIFIPHRGKGGDGYIRIALWSNNKSKAFLMHRLLAIHFIPNTNNKPFVNHIDGTRNNNSLNNLEWATQSDNMRHAMNMGVMKKQFKSGFDHQLCKLTPQDVRGIKKMRKAGKTLKEIGEIYSISGRHVSGIARGEVSAYINI